MGKTERIVCRFAPSPTGFLHVGGARTALFNYLFARQNGGKLILRIEDTDRERSKKEYEEDILEGFKWLSIDFDETIRQSDRISIHQRYLKTLLDKGAAYVSKEKPVKVGQRQEVIRFKNPNREVYFNDLIKGDITFNTTELGDFVIAKSLEEPLFHLAVVVDDFLMGITHVIRGEDHISNTPRQILIQEAIGAPRPVYGHIPLILAADRSKLSKRKHGEVVSVSYYHKLGYFPEALVNYLALLGWNPGDERELLSREELVREFSIEKVQKGGAIFNLEKLNWMNREYLLKKPVKEVISELVSMVNTSEKLASLTRTQKEQIAEILRERIHSFADVKTLIEAGEFNYLAHVSPYEPEALLWSKSPDVSKTKTHLEAIVNILQNHTENLEKDLMKKAIMPYAEREGKGEVLWPLRFALSGKAKSPDPFILLSILGKSESLARIKNALHLLQ